MIRSEWIRTGLPPTWKIARVRDHADIVNGYPFDSKLFTTDVGMGLVRIRDISNVETEVCYAGDPVPEALLKGGEILIGMDGDFNVARWRGGEALLNQRVCSVVPMGSVDAQFLFYVLPAPLALINEFTYSTTVKHLSSFDVLKIHFPFPPFAQQRAIADYLDRETARIDALIAAKELLLGLLAEKRRALITRAVTRGLDPHVPLCDSAIPWLGKIPAHWAVERLKFHLDWIEQGWSPICDNAPAEDAEWGVLKAGCVNGGRFDTNENKRLPIQSDALPEYEVHPRDVVMSRANTTELLGSAAIVGAVRPRLLLCDKLYRLGVNDSTLLREYLVAFLGSPVGRYEFERDATGASNSMQNIGQDPVRNLWLTVPPLVEQEAIVSFLNVQLRQLQQVSAATQRTVTLLRERRATVIAAAVTGKIAVEAVA